jgi:hypothetical protein
MYARRYCNKIELAEDNMLMFIVMVVDALYYNCVDAYIPLVGVCS